MKTKEITRYIYGPVPSWRLGRSLGVDIVPFKTCSFNCIYCETGRTTNLTLERKEYVPKASVIEELRTFLSKRKNIDYITFSGSGEPTLNSRIGEMIREVKKLTNIPVAIVTNSSLLNKEKVRGELREADVVLPSLDVVSQSLFESLNRPHPSLKIEEIIEGLIEFRKEFKNKIWLEVLLVKGINDNPEEIHKLAEVIKKIKPDKVQLNTVLRPPVEEEVFALNQKELSSIQKQLPGKVEVVRKFKKVLKGGHIGKLEMDIKNLLQRRPCTLSDISHALRVNPREVMKNLTILKGRAEIRAELHNKKRYYISTKRSYG
ncbi:radical SAM protein [bacterium]|nr:radical SAM protein [bacterium]NIN92068.1 radical SAM protein [bacterium]NIO18281.1 radical SAM protein [bacterium]NIO73255.1 radical SAM protein [bacterium]